MSETFGFQGSRVLCFKKKVHIVISTSGCVINKIILGEIFAKVQETYENVLKA